MAENDTQDDQEKNRKKDAGGAESDIEADMTRNDGPTNPGGYGDQVTGGASPMPRSEDTNPM